MLAATSFRKSMGIYIPSHNLFLGQKKSAQPFSLLHNFNRNQLPSPLTPYLTAIYKEVSGTFKAIMSPTINGILANGTSGRRNFSSSTGPLSPSTPKPQWGPGDIDTLVFGCVASILGVFTLWATLGRRRFLRAGGNGVYIDWRS